MSNNGGFCGRCGAKLKLLFSSWYCDCDQDDSVHGYALLVEENYLKFADPTKVPVGTVVYLFNSLDIGKEFAAAFLGFILLRVDLTHEYVVTYSSTDSIYAHDVSSELPCEVVQ